MNGQRERYRRSSAGRWYRCEIDTSGEPRDWIRRLRAAVLFKRGQTVGW